MERVRSGENSYYGTLIARYHRRLYCVALRILRNDAEAEDALQDAYILALTRLEQFAGRSSFYTWMARITMNEAFTRIRSRQRAQRLEAAVEAPSNVHRFFAHVPSPEQQAFHNELDTAFATSVRSLPDHYRTVFTLREIDEMSTAEAACSLGITEECVKTRLHRARELLQKRLARRVRWRERAAA
ncbi:MAG TPA: sigma-70 family RNA polymerase sigma factor [Bryobacteraceae bacterium]|nr:sigma-70 family RNA polymerase sigma factor [Bryobacteraceae bacterium]